MALEGKNELHGCTGGDHVGEQQEVAELQRVVFEVDTNTVVLVLEPGEKRVHVDALHLVVEERVAERHGDVVRPGVGLAGDDVQVFESLRVELDVVLELFDRLGRVVRGTGQVDRFARNLTRVVRGAVGQNAVHHEAGLVERVDIVVGLDNLAVVDNQTLGVEVCRDEGDGGIGSRAVVRDSEHEESVDTSVHVGIGILQDDRFVGGTVSAVVARAAAIGSVGQHAFSALHNGVFLHFFVVFLK